MYVVMHAIHAWHDHRRLPFLLSTVRAGPRLSESSVEQARVTVSLLLQDCEERPSYPLAKREKNNSCNHRERSHWLNRAKKPQQWHPSDVVHINLAAAVASTVVFTKVEANPAFLVATVRIGLVDLCALG